MRSRRVLVLVLALAVLSQGCEKDLSLSHTVGSARELAVAVVHALATRNDDALRRLELSEYEFRTLVWPKLPASRPERNVPVEYAWNDLHSKSDLHRRARLGSWQDQGFSVVRVDFTGATTDYETFRVLRDSQITLRDREGRETTARLFGSAIESGGRYKVFSYVVD